VLPDAGDVDLLEGGTSPPVWRRLWAATSPGVRWALAVLVVAALVVGGAVVLRERAAEQALRERVDLAATLGIASSSTNPPGGSVRFFVLLRNAGPRPVTVAAVDGTGEGLRLRMLDQVDRPLPAGAEVEIPLSVRLTCPAGAGELTADVRVRRQDGGPASRRLRLEPAGLLLDVAATVCSVRPDLRDHELAGPVLRGT
jgi:hypothetical protein